MTHRETLMLHTDIQTIASLQSSLLYIAQGYPVGRDPET